MPKPKPPQDGDAEVSVLASMMMNLDACGMAIERLESDDFYFVHHKFIFEELQELFDNNKPIDLVTLRNSLDKKNLLEKAGGTELLATIVEGEYVSSHIEYYIDLVREKSILRKLLEKSMDIERLVHGHVKKPVYEVSEILELVEQGIFEISDHGTKSNLKTAKEIVTDVYDEIFTPREDGIKTGFSEIDQLTGGFRPGQLIVIAGRPSMGKTSFALNIAAYVSGNCGIPVGIFSMEMDGHDIFKSIISSRSHVSSTKISTGGTVFNQQEIVELQKTRDQVAAMELVTEDITMLSPRTLKSIARRMKSRHKVKMIIIDYLQLMDAGRKAENRQQEISYITRRLKAMARELNVPVIALCQLSRNPELRGDKRPYLADLRESGAIEQDADLVFLLFREWYYNKEDPSMEFKAEVNLAKHRKGMTKSDIQLEFKAEFVEFRDVIPKFDDE